MLVFQVGLRRRADGRSSTLRSSGARTDLATAEEGCLSLPGVVVDVERPLHVRVTRPSTCTASRSLIEASGLEARVLQHEMDHLDGVLILDRTEREQRKARAAGAARGRHLQRPSARKTRTRDPTPSDDVRTVYLGTSEFAATVLRRLAGQRRTARPSSSLRPTAGGAGGASWLAACPRPRPRGARDRSPSGTETSTTRSRWARSAQRSPRLVAVCAFGQLIKRAAALASSTMLNVHPSLLPRWRGAAPIERALMAGDARTGVTIMRVTAGLDSGPVALAERDGDRARDDYGRSPARLAQLGGELLVRALDLRGRGGSSSPSRTTRGHLCGEDRPGGAPPRPAGPRRSSSAWCGRSDPHIGAYLELEGGGRLGVRAARTAGDGPETGTIEVREDRLVARMPPMALCELDVVQPPGREPMRVTRLPAWARPPAGAL